MTIFESYGPSSANGFPRPHLGHTRKCPRGSVEQSVLLKFAVMGPDFKTFMKYKNGSSSAVTSSKYQPCVFLYGSSSSTTCHVWSSLKRSIGWFFPPRMQPFCPIQVLRSFAPDPLTSIDLPWRTILSS